MPSFAHRAPAVGNFHVKRDEVIAGRYRVTDEAGAGNFARVLKAYDMKQDRMVAVKILKREYQRDAQFENEILASINKCDKEGTQKVCKMEAHFMWGDLPCFVFGLLGQSLKMCAYGQKHVDDATLANFAKQSCSTLAFLHFTCKLIHTDLKPENILLESPNKPNKGIGEGWAICDLGSASFFSSNPDQDLIQTRPYRAPEVVLGGKWSFGVDMWSIGCILYELKQGAKLFDATNDEQQLMMFEKRVGRLPTWLVRNGDSKVRRQFFDASDRLVHSASVFANPYGKSTHPSRTLAEEFSGEPEFLDFLMSCLHYDPIVRMRADEAAHHPWVQKHWSTTSKDALLRKLPTSAYGSAIHTPGTKLISGDTPLTKEQKASLMPQTRPAAPSSSSSSSTAQHGLRGAPPPSAPGSVRTSSPPGLTRVGSTNSVDMMRRKEEVVRHAAAALKPHMQPPAGMPSTGRPTNNRQTPFMAPPRPTPPREPSHAHYATSSSAYGSSLRGHGYRAIPAPTGPPSAPPSQPPSAAVRRYLTPAF